MEMETNKGFSANENCAGGNTGKSEPVVMGIINVNEESFYSASRCCNLTAFCRQLESMVADGAGIIDIGACSTRPGSTPITVEQEWQLLKGPLEHIASAGLAGSGKMAGVVGAGEHTGITGVGEHTGITGVGENRLRVSIDTFRSEIVRRAYDIIGDFIVNDISAGEDDAQMLPTVGKLGLEYIAMHKRGTPSTMQQLCDYPRGVVREVAEYFLEFEKRAALYGIREYIVDPGFGFAKSVKQNYELFMGMPQLMNIVSGKVESSKVKSGQINNTSSGSCQKSKFVGETQFNHTAKSSRCGTSSSSRRLLVGISRKSMIYKPLGITPESSLCATAALNLQALMLGADILRVHDVKEAVECVKLYKLLQQ